MLSRFGMSCGRRVPSDASSYPYALPGDGMEGGSGFRRNVIRLVLYIYKDSERNYHGAVFHWKIWSSEAKNVFNK